MSESETSIIDPKLNRHKGLILSLIPHAEHPRLMHVVKQACEQRYGRLSISVHHEIVNEVKKLAAPCSRHIDLRCFFDNCEQYEHQNIVHHLDKKAKSEFCQQIDKHHGRYNVAIYRSVMSQSKKRHRELKGKKQEERKSSQLLFPVREQPLLNHLFYEKEDASNESPTLWMTRRLDKLDEDEILSEGRKFHVLRCDPGFIRVKIPPNSVIPREQKLFIYIHQHNRLLTEVWADHAPIKLAVDVLKKQVIQHTGAEVWDLKVNRLTSLEMARRFDDYSRAVSKANQLTREEQVPPLLQSILAKIHQQWWSANQKSLSIMLRLSENGRYEPLFKMNNTATQALFDFLTTQQAGTIESLSAQPVLQQALSKTESQLVLIGIFSYQKAYYLETCVEKLMSPRWQKAIASGEAKLLRISTQSISTKRALFYPSALPKVKSGDFSLLNRPLPQQTQELLKQCTKRMGIDDISELISAVCRIDKNSNESPLEALAQETTELVMDNSQKAHTIFVGQHDLRREDRFECTLEVNLQSAKEPNKKVRGLTENISSKGLKVQCQPLFKWEPGEQILVNITLPFGKKNHAFKKQAYQLVGQAGKRNLRLEFMGTTGSRNIVDRAIQHFLYRNMDKLTRCVQQKEVAPRISEATQHLEALHPDGTPFFIEQNKQQWFIRSAATQEQSALYKVESTLLEQLNILFNQAPFREICLRSLNAIEKKSDTPSVFVAISSDKTQSFFARNLKDLHKQPSLMTLLKNAPKNKRPLILKIDLARAGSIVKKGFLAEKERLRRIAPRKAEDIDQLTAATVGVGCLKNITTEAWDLFDKLWLTTDEAVKKAKTG